MEAYQSFIQTLENSLAPLGLMTGEFAIPKRFLFGAALGAALVVLLKPDAMFLNGQARPWTPFSKDGDIEPTWVPWWSVPILGAFFFGVLI